MVDVEFKYDVFLSHNSKDKPAVEKIARILRDDYGLKVWLDKWNLTPGKPWQEELEEGLENSETIAVFLGEAGFGKWENEEMRVAVNSRVNDPSRRVIPVLLPGAPESPKLSAFLSRYTWVDLRTGFDTKASLYRLYCGITGKAPGDQTFKPSNVQPFDFAQGKPETWNLKHPYPMPPNFTGRIAERATLTHWLNEDSENHLLIIRALGGFGKSALTWHWLTHDVAPQAWTKVVFWSFYEGDASFENFVRETLEYLGREVPQSGRNQVEELLRALQSQNILLIMDGFERALRAYSSMNAAYMGDDGQWTADDRSLDCVNVDAETFLKGVCSLPHVKGKVLMTTRLTPHAVYVGATRESPLQPLQGMREIELTAMQKADAVEFFHKQGIKGRHDEIEAACEPYGYHPLSLRLLVGRILKDLRNPGDIAVAQTIQIDGDLKQHQNHILKVAYESLPRQQQNLLGQIACFRSPVDMDTLTAVCKPVKTKGLWGFFKKTLNLYIGKLENDLHDLVERGLLHHTTHLISSHPISTFDLHPIVRRYAYDRLTAPERTNSHGILIIYFEAVPKPEKVNTLEDLAPVIELYHHTVRAGKLDEACDLAYDRLKNAIYFQFGAYQLQIELLRALFLNGEDKPPRLKKESDQAWTLNELANSYSLSGQPRRAVPLFEMVNALKEKAGDKKNLAIGLGNVASMAYIYIGALSAAERNLRRGIKLCHEVSADGYITASKYRDLGKVLSYCGNWKDAERNLSEADEIFKKDNHVQGQSTVWSYRALRFLLMAREAVVSNQSSIVNLKSSIECAQRALELADEDARTDAPTPRDYIDAYRFLGAAYLMNNDLTLAEENLSKALNLCRQINLVEMEADILLDLARLRYAQGDFKDAQEKASEALVITERCGYVLQGADVNLFLATLALEVKSEKLEVGEWGGKEMAKKYAEEALRLATCDGPPYYYKVAYEEAERMLEKLR